MASEALQQAQQEYIAALQQLRLAEQELASAEESESGDFLTLLRGRKAAAEAAVNKLKVVYDAVPASYPATYTVAYDPIVPSSRTLSSELGDVSARVVSTEGEVPGRAAALEVLNPVIVRQSQTLVPIAKVGAEGVETAAIIFQDSGGHNLASIHASTALDQLEITSNTTVFSNDIYVTGRATVDDLQMHSDERLKKDVETLDGAICSQQIRRMRPVTYKWKEPVLSQVGVPHYGFIAQEMEQVVPEMVSTNSMGVKVLHVNEFFGLIVSSLQHMDTRVAQLEGENRSMKRRIHDLEVRMFAGSV